MLLWNLKPGQIVRFDDVLLKVIECRRGEVRLGVESKPHVKFTFETPKPICDNNAQGSTPRQ